MPELPEVETTRLGISPHLVGQDFRRIDLRDTRLRWPIPDLVADLTGHSVTALSRRAKYLLAEVSGPVHQGTLILHLGMSGSLRIATPDIPLRKHDHAIFALGSGVEMRFHDPRRFGCILWHEGDPADHKLIRDLGPEPLEDDFDTDVLAATCASRSAPIKQVIMDGRVVVGVGNIYACEALHTSGIHPARAASRISKKRLTVLVNEIKKVLQRSITQGGTTLRDFLHEDGSSGYFKQQLTVYDRENKPCRKCGTQIKRMVQAQRSTFYCPKCQR